MPMADPRNASSSQHVLLETQMHLFESADMQAGMSLSGPVSLIGVQDGDAPSVELASMLQKV